MNSLHWQLFKKNPENIGSRLPWLIYYFTPGKLLKPEAFRVPRIQAEHKIFIRVRVNSFLFVIFNAWISS